MDFSEFEDFCSRVAGGWLSVVVELLVPVVLAVAAFAYRPFLETGIRACQSIYCSGLCITFARARAISQTRPSL